MVETLHKKPDGTDRQYPIIPQEQGQEANTDVLKLPGTENESRQYVAEFCLHCSCTEMITQVVYV